MKIRVLETCSLVAQKGSIVEVAQSQYEALGSLCELVNDEPVKAEKKVIETPEKEIAKTTAKRATKAKKEV